MSILIAKSCGVLVCILAVRARDTSSVLLLAVMLQILSGQAQPMLLLAGVMSLGLLWLFMPPICSKPYRGFSLVVVEIASGEAIKEVRGGRRWQSAF